MKILNRCSQRMHRCLVRASYAQPMDLQGQRIIVTGASADSLGEAAARLLASWGAEVVVTTRQQPERAADAIRAQLPAEASGSVSGLALDLCDANSVASFASDYAKLADGRLDVLVNCAGIHLDLGSKWKSPKLSADGHEIHWRTNYRGSMQLTHALLPLLLDTAQRRGGARIVNVVSMLHDKGRNKDLFGPLQPYNSWVAYGLSKLALVHATFELQRRYADRGLQTSCLHPGGVVTRIADKGFENSPFFAAMRRALSALERLFLLTPEEGAQTILYCATAKHIEGGRYYRNCQPAPHSPEADDAAVAARLWEHTLASLPEADARTPG